MISIGVPTTPADISKRISQEISLQAPEQISLMLLGLEMAIGQDPATEDSISARMPKFEHVTGYERRWDVPLRKPTS